MREKHLLNSNWQFHYGPIDPLPTTVKKAFAIGGATAPLPDEGQRLPISAGGEHFLKLIAQGNEEIGLRNLAGTKLDDHLAGQWQQVDLPHDWKASLPYSDDPRLLMAGGKVDGVGVYRKVFHLNDTQQKRVILHFDGVMRSADIWLNGAYLGHHRSGYSEFAYDITETCQPNSANVLLVRVDSTTGSEGWWYEGAGIYRDVWFEMLPEVHLNGDDAYVETQALDHEGAHLGIQASVTNDSDHVITTAPTVKLIDQVVTLTPQTIAPGATAHFQTDITVPTFQPWTPETPHCYQAEFNLANSDVLSKTFGIHTFAYTTEGFRLNDQPYVLNGVCEHQDFVGVGVALTQDLVDYKIQALKQMGVNALRSAHHFASPQLLNACDRYGILLIDENRILEATPWRQADLALMVKKQRMHPCVAFWSLANEEIVGNTALGARNLKRFAQIVRRLDTEHLIVSAELLNPEGEINDDYVQWLDVLGLNYPEAGVMGDGALKIRQTHPKLPVMSTESASYFQTRGAYRDDPEHAQANSLGSMYSMVLPGKRAVGDPGVGGTARPEVTMAFAHAHPEFSGVFLWTAFDYAGEPSPFQWPAIGSQFGMLDTCGFPKAYYYYFQAQWTTKPMVVIATHWNREVLDVSEQGQVPVRVFANAKTVDLQLNGKSLGMQAVSDYQAQWQVPYASGKLVAIAYGANHQIIAQTTRVTAGTVAKLEVTPRYQGQQQTLWQVQALDADNHPVPLCDDVINVTATAGQVLALGNGDPADTEVPSVETIHLFNGKALIIATKAAQLDVHLAPVAPAR